MTASGLANERPMPTNEEFDQRFEDLKRKIDRRKRLVRLTWVLAFAMSLGIFGVTWDRTIPNLLRSAIVAALAAATISFLLHLVISLLLARGKARQ